MQTWRVRDLMTTDVITAPDTASMADLVALLTERQISAVPITDRFDVVLGLVSWTDLHRKISVSSQGNGRRAGWLSRFAPSLHWPKGTAVEVMSGPAVTIGPDATPAAAAREMHRTKVGRLVVVDEQHRLRGIITRSDLLGVHSRLDAVIRDEVLQVLGGTLPIQPGAVEVSVDGGVVVIAGRTARRTTAVAAVRLTETVPGVTEVVDRLTADVDDTAAVVPERRTSSRDPLLGWWTERLPVWWREDDTGTRNAHRKSEKELAALG
ncbi:CBS domain-containing protein [Actinoplanes friuliensis]|uniref:Cbs domain-containing membrane protein n=1 Tax=Actinoplanes friuliensis DSM 7358 TaxID=1246995 RepID=U5VZ45_9ACTN|nr:CBS domain-containing protein [Actinoplanes friuliensis]AGZ41000.1 cbs domain-containing membrane protein [Actinoplanes friuliensis DSM 7358]